MGISLGKYIKSVRKSEKKTAAALSKEINIAKTYLDQIESGTREPKPAVIAKIAAALNLPLNALMEIEKNDQLQFAISKFTIEGITINDKLTIIEQRALAMIQNELEGKNDPSKFLSYIENPDLRQILKVGLKLSGENLEKIRKIIELIYPQEFS